MLNKQAIASKLAFICVLSVMANVLPGSAAAAPALNEDETYCYLLSYANLGGTGDVAKKGFGSIKMTLPLPGSYHGDANSQSISLTPNYEQILSAVHAVEPAGVPISVSRISCW